MIDDLHHRLEVLVSCQRRLHDVWGQLFVHHHRLGATAPLATSSSMEIGSMVWPWPATLDGMVVATQCLEYVQRNAVPGLVYWCKQPNILQTLVLSKQTPQ